MLKVCEIFQGIQGEGQTVGHNCVFVRLSGCTLNCRFCDTPYHKEEFKLLEKQQVLEEIWEYKANTVVFTGGEPLLQQKELGELIKMLPIDYCTVVETNGTIIPNESIATYTDYFACSPKLANSGNDIDKRLNYDAIQRLKDLDTIFKFVISCDEDIKEVQFIQEQLDIRNDQIWLMKEGATKKEQETNLDKFMKKCLSLGYNFSPRLQIMVYDKKRRV